MQFFKKLFRPKEKKEQSTCSVVMVAAGTATRMEGKDKILYDLGGTPVIIHSLRPFELSPMVQEIIIVTRHDIMVEISQLCKLYGCNKVTKIIPGGDTRTESVRLGVNEVREGTDLVAIHDGARPFVTLDVLEEAIKTAAEFGAAAPSISVKDTIKTVAGGVVQETLPRDSLCAVQTPQVFERSLIRAALAKAIQDDLILTDDCSAVERLGFPVVMTRGSEENMKLTTPNDLLLAESILAARDDI